jgi:hypothetical protein
MRVIGSALRLVVAAVLLAGLAACVSDRPPAASGTGTPPPPGATPGPSSTSGPSPTPRRTAPPPTTKLPPATRGDDIPGPLPMPDRRYVGTVERVGDCTMLLSGQRRVALLGPMAESLKVGQRVTVTGQPAIVPDACARREAFQALRVSAAEPA